MKNVRFLLIMLAMSAMLCTVMLNPAVADLLIPISVPNTALSATTGPLACFDDYDHSGTIISFSLIKTPGTLASESDVLTNNASGYLATAHILVNSDLGSHSFSPLTGFAGNGTHSVPEAGALLMLVISLVGLVGYRRMRRMR